MKNYTLLLIPTFLILLGIPTIFSEKKLPPEPTDSISNGIISPPPQKLISPNIDTSKAGINFITNYRLENIVNKQVWAMEQAEDGTMFFANQRGIITYNGNEWGFVKTTGVPYTIAKEPNSQTVFVGCNNSVGYLEKKDGKYVFSQILEHSSYTKNISKILFSEEEIFFYGEKVVIKVKKNKFSDKAAIQSSDDKHFYGLFKFKNSIFLKTSDNNFQKFTSNDIETKKIDGLLPEAEILFSIEKSEKEIIIGSSNDLLYTFDGEKITPFETDAKDYILENYLVSALNFSETSFLVSTLSGGVLIIDKQTGKTLKMLNFLTGLPDNEFFSAGLDFNNGLWLSHAFGLSRVDFSLPIKNYSGYIGLEGKIISTEITPQNMYVITTEGTYFLAKPKSKKELEVVEKAEKQKAKQTSDKNLSEDAIENTEIEQAIIEENKTENTDNEEDKKDKKENILKKWKRKIFGKKYKNKNENDDNENKTETENTTTDSTQVETVVVEVDSTETEKPDNNTTPPNNNTYTVEVEYKDITPQVFLPHYFKKVKNLDLRCREIISVDERVFVSTNSGFYEIENGEAKPILEDRYILKTYKSQNNNQIYISSTYGLDLVKTESSQTEVKNIFANDTINDNIFSIAEQSENVLWLGGEGYAYKLTLENDKMSEIETYSLSPDFLQKVIVKNIEGKIMFFLADGIFEYNQTNNNVEKDKSFNEKSINSTFFVDNQSNIIWYNQSGDWNFHANENLNKQELLKYFKLFENIKDIKIAENGDILIVDNYRQIYKIESEKAINYKSQSSKVEIEKVLLNDVEISKANITISYKNIEGLKFKVASPSYLKENSTMYSYYIEGSMQSWSDWSPEQIIPIYVSAGKYTLHVKSKNIFGEETEIETISFFIKPPFWKTNLFYILLAMGLVLIGLIIASIIFSSLRRRNKILEQKVAERTAEIEQQKEELKAQKDEIQKHYTVTLVQKEEITAQRDEIQKQHDIVTHQKEEITQSINYARRIQKAVLPPLQVLEASFSEYFVINLPRDVVSGDYYWIKEKADKLIVSVADCTGHGVPGAFLSMLGSAYLNEIVTNTNKLKASEILNFLRLNVISALHVTAESDNKDGMDIAICVFDLENKTMEFAGAYNPVYIIRDGKLTEINGDRMPIGFHRNKEVPFTNNLIDIKENDQLYMFSDGIIDQFGGKHGRKFRKNNFKELLKLVSDMPMNDQKEMIIKAFMDWKGQIPQLDDIIIMGLKVK